jgi:hypothetical protein
MLKIWVDCIECSQFNMIRRNRFHSIVNVEEENSMSTEHKDSENNTCTEKCDDDFIRCVDQSRANCLDNFSTCASVCRR